MHQGANRECCSDYFVSSYTPTLTALLRAQEGQRTFPSDQIKLLAIAAEYAHDSSGPRLQHVLREVQKVLYAVEETGVLGRSDAGAGTTGDVVEMIKSANLVHFACHGNQHHSEPHKSHFCLTTGNLSVTELMEVDLENAFFAFLSACETAKGDTDHADEVVHLAATMLFAGFKSVVATMWSVSRRTR
jgi:CHAT domain-containing protein